MPTHTTTIEGRTATIHLLDDEEYQAAYDRHDIDEAAWYSSIHKPRGWASGGNVYVKADAWGLRRLLAHEIGHILGHDHTPLPTTMNFTGLLRWWDREGLLRHADRILEEMQ